MLFYVLSFSNSERTCYKLNTKIDNQTTNANVILTVVMTRNLQSSVQVQICNNFNRRSTARIYCFVKDYLTHSNKRNLSYVSVFEYQTSLFTIVNPNTRVSQNKLPLKVLTIIFLSRLHRCCPNRMSDSEEEVTERQFKIALIGDPEVGKTSIATRYASGRCQELLVGNARLVFLLFYSINRAMHGLLICIINLNMLFIEAREKDHLLTNHLE